MATKQIRVCDIFGTHEAETVQVVIFKLKPDDPNYRWWQSDRLDMSDRAQKRLISFIERGLRPPSKKAKTDE